MLKLVEMDSTESNFVPDRSDMDSVATSDACGGDVDTDGMTTANKTDQEIKEVTQDSGVETESSIVELEINKKPIVCHSVDTNSDTGNGQKGNDRNESTSTDKIFASFQSGDMMSVPSASEFNGGDSPETIELSSDCTSGKSKDSEAPEPTDKQQNSTVTPTDLKEDEKKDDGIQQNDNDAVSTEPAEDDEDELTKEDLMKTERQKSVPDVPLPMPEKEKTDSSVGNGTQNDKDEVTKEDLMKTERQKSDVLMAEKEMTVSQNSVVGDAPAEKMSAADVLMAEKETTVSQNSVVADATEEKMSAADVPMAEKETTVSQNSVVGDAPEEKTSAADVPTPVKEMTFAQKSVAADAPVIPTSAADVPSPVKEMTSGDAAVQEMSAGDVPNIPTSVADVPTDSTVPRSPSVATPHESVPEKIASEGDVCTNATDSTGLLTDSMAQTSQKEYKDTFGPKGERQ